MAEKKQTKAELAKEARSARNNSVGNAPKAKATSSDGGAVKK
jgi:hypothetical protein